MNYLRNHSDIIRAKLEAQAAVVRERASNAQQRLEVNQQKIITDVVQRRIETLHAEKTNLQSNKITLGKTSSLSLAVQCV